MDPIKDFLETVKLARAQVYQNLVLFPLLAPESCESGFTDVRTLSSSPRRLRRHNFPKILLLSCKWFFPFPDFIVRIDHPEVIDATWSYPIVGAGIVIDKGRLMDGEATEIRETKDATMGELVADLGDVLRRCPQIAVEVTRLVADLPEGNRGRTMRVIEDRGLVPKDMGDRDRRRDAPVA